MKIKLQKILFANALRIEVFATDTETGQAYNYIGYGHRTVEHILNNWNKTIEVECMQMSENTMMIK